MWKIIEFIAVAAVVLIFLTEFFYPILAGKPLFGSFRKQKQNSGTKKSGSLDDKLNEAKAKVEDIKNVQKEVDDHYKTAEQLKEESDKLLNKKNQ